MIDRTRSYLQAINEAIHLEMQNDPNVIILGEDIAGGIGMQDQGVLDAWGGAFGSTKGLIKEFGFNRVLDTPISETAFLGASVGAAVTGLRPIVEIMFVDFVAVCADQLFNQAAKMRYMFGGQVNCPITIKLTVGAGKGAAAQHSQFWAPLFTHIPGLKVIAPATPYDMKGLLASAILDNDPVVVLEHKALFGNKGVVPQERYTIPIGKGEVKLIGNDVSIVSFSKALNTCLEAAQKLSLDGINCEVIDLRSLSPLDETIILDSVKKTGRLIVVDESNPRCSLASDISSLVSEKGFYDLKAPIKNVTSRHTPVPYSPVLEHYYSPNTERIMETVKDLLNVTVN
ncbi:MAG TPA: alpha-ketoacid dehydrogenase subunit beta [Clostridiales bacterium]|nr:alpha-ketoacid dehydrogenase subunit beta [Clostridiales bacterium]